jgi:Phytanoyl-CoA dioxygenase (PhyH)
VMRKYHARFGGGPTEKAGQPDLAGGLPYIFREKGPAALADGIDMMELPTGPVQITGQAGDAVITHHQIIHAAAPNCSPDIRYAAIFRGRHKDVEANGTEAMTDIWREWPGIREVIELSTA